MELLFLVGLHFIGDYVLQNDFLAKNKGDNEFLLAVHCYLWTSIICAGLLLLGKFTIASSVFLFIGHFIIDRKKAKRKDKSKALTTDLYIDQALHLIQLIMVLY